MREYWFRGKRVDNEEWAYGYYGVLGKDTDIERTVMMEATLDAHSVNDNFYFTDIEVIKNTVGQYTGREDVCSNHIFENDIVKINEDEFIGYVKWDNEESMYVITCSDAEVDLGNCHNYELEVIGNVFDNTELLELNGIKIVESEV